MEIISPNSFVIHSPRDLLLYNFPMQCNSITEIETWLISLRAAANNMALNYFLPRHVICNTLTKISGF